jgi:hypothetical protein
VSGSCGTKGVLRVEEPSIWANPSETVRIASESEKTNCAAGFIGFGAFI